MINKKIKELKDEFFKLFGYETGGTMGEIYPIIDKHAEELKKEIEGKIDNRLIVLKQHEDLESVRVVVRELEELKKEMLWQRFCLGGENGIKWNT